ncbi:MAG TPA: CobD/CbiB family protein [Burkholderiales bacterium]|nr:CobD/CbiB family protein [Burkholderiales bacterium]
MSALAVIAALAAEQWRPLADLRGWQALLAGWADGLERAFNAGESHQGVTAWLVAVVPAVVASMALYALLAWISPLLGLAFNALVLYLTLGFREPARRFSDLQLALRAGDLERARGLIGEWRGEPAQQLGREEVMRLALEEALLASHRHVFGVLFWFVLLPGPAGAVLYRLAAALRRRWRALGAFGGFAARAAALLDWPAVRLTAASFAVVGDFEDAVYCWRTQAPSWPDREAGVVLAAGAGALGVRLGMPVAGVDGMEPRVELGVGEAVELPFLDSAIGLVWRAVVLWVFVLLLVAVATLF